MRYYLNVQFQGQRVNGNETLWLQVQEQQEGKNSGRSKAALLQPFEVPENISRGTWSDG